MLPIAAGHPALRSIWETGLRRRRVPRLSRASSRLAVRVTGRSTIPAAGLPCRAGVGVPIIRNAMCGFVRGRRRGRLPTLSTSTDVPSGRAIAA